MAEREPPVILLVDDEEMILTAIKSFLAVETDYDLLAYSSPVKALQDLSKTKSIDLVISDYLMPEMDGISFLGEIKKRFPLAPRILLTGYADKENAIRAINDVGLYYYVEKPWNNDDLRLIIRNGLEKSVLLRQLEEKVLEIEKVHGEFNEVQKKILRMFV